jgi:hypothetical protein
MGRLEKNAETGAGTRENEGENCPEWTCFRQSEGCSMTIRIDNLRDLPGMEIPEIIQK